MATPRQAAKSDRPLELADAAPQPEVAGIERLRAEALKVNLTDLVT